MAIRNQLIRTQNTVLLQNDSDKPYAITNILVCNSSETDAATFNMHLKPLGVPISDTETIIVKNMPLPPAETFTFDSERIIISPGDNVTLTGLMDSYPTFSPVTSNNFRTNYFYEISSLGNTDWNVVAGTTGITYNVGDVVEVEQTFNGTGEGFLKNYTSLVATVSYLEV